MSDEFNRTAGDHDLAAFVHRQAEEKAQAIIAEARARADEIEREAFGEARHRLRTVKRQERARVRELSRMAEARMYGRIAARRREIEAKRLEHLHTELASVLEEFWRTPSLRTVWICAAVTKAKAAFEFDDWTVKLFGWGEAESAEALHGLVPADAKIVAGGEHSIGLQIWRGDAVLDATIAGFLARGVRLDALLLAALERQKTEEQ